MYDEDRQERDERCETDVCMMMTDDESIHPSMMRKQEKTRNTFIHPSIHPM
jgi:hypothetical protein